MPDREPKKRRGHGRSTQRGVGGADAILNFLHSGRWSKLGQIGVGLGMRSDRVPLPELTAYELGSGVRVHSEHKEIGGNTLRRQGVQNVAGRGPDRTVVEAKNNFVIPQRQRLRILNGANLRQHGRVDADDAAGADGVGISRTFACGSGRRDAGERRA